MKRILLCGTFDRQMMAYAEYLKNQTPKAYVGALSYAEYKNFPVNAWEFCEGSSSYQRCLSRYDTAVWFNLSPIERGIKNEKRNEALMAAIQFVKAARRQSNLRVILVVRAFPLGDRTFGTSYNNMFQIYQLFHKSCKNLRIIRACPEISKYDCLTRAIFEHALTKRGRASEENIQWLNLVNPVMPGRLNTAIDNIIDEPEGCVHILQGDRIISYEDWMHWMQHDMPRFSAFLMRRLKTLTHMPASQSRALLLETLAFHSVDETDMHSAASNDEKLKAMTQDFVDEMLEDDAPDLIIEKRHKTGRCITHIEHVPRRSLCETADLLMRWLPSFFKKSLNLEENADNGIVCRISSIPLFEIERKESEDFYCELQLRWPWGQESGHTITLCKTPGNEKNPGILLISCKSQSYVWHTIFHQIVSSFGRFLEEFG